MTRAAPTTYEDTLGRPWSPGKLDALLADEGVLPSVMSGVSIGLNPNGTWSPGRVWTIAKMRYRRNEPAALLLLLVTRYFDTEGAHYLGRERAV